MYYSDFEYKGDKMLATVPASKYYLEEDKPAAYMMSIDF